MLTILGSCGVAAYGRRSYCTEPPERLIGFAHDPGQQLIRGASTTQPPGVRNVLVTAGTGVPTSALILSGA